MPYSINIRSDDGSSSRIRDLWALCERLEERPSMRALGYPPHFTLAVLDDAQEPRLVAAVESLPESLSTVTVRFDRIAHFETPSSIVLWAAPSNPAPLAELHGQVHERVNSGTCRSNYRPGFWVPHCSLAVAIDLARRSEAMAIVQSEVAPFEVAFDVIDCARFHPVEVFYERVLPAAAYQGRCSGPSKPSPKLLLQFCCRFARPLIAGVGRHSLDQPPSARVARPIGTKHNGCSERNPASIQAIWEFPASLWSGFEHVLRQVPLRVGPEAPQGIG